MPPSFPPFSRSPSSGPQIESPPDVALYSLLSFFVLLGVSPSGYGHLTSPTPFMSHRGTVSKTHRFSHRSIQTIVLQGYGLHEPVDCVDRTHTQFQTNLTLSGTQHKHELTLSGSHRNPSSMPDTNQLSSSSPPQPWDSHSVLNAAKSALSECSSVESSADFCRSPCILPAAEKTRLVSWKFDGLLPGQYLTANDRPKNSTKYLPGSFETVYVVARYLSGSLNCYVAVLKTPLLMVNPSLVVLSETSQACL